MIWTILIIWFQLPTTKACLSFYPSLHTPNLDPILHKQPHEHLWKKRKTFQPEQDLKFRARCTPRAPWTCSRSKPLRPQFRQQEIKLLRPSFAKKIKAKPIKFVGSFGWRRWGGGGFCFPKSPKIIFWTNGQNLNSKSKNCLPSE